MREVSSSRPGPDRGDCQQTAVSPVYGAVKRIAVAFAGLALVLTAPAAALASKRPTYLAPPGNSAVTQYLEVVPTDAGPSPPSAGGGSPANLSAGQKRQLKPYGSQGELLAAVVAATAPRGLTGASLRAGDGRDRGSRSRILRSATQPPSTPSRSAPAARLPAPGRAGSPVAAVLAAATGRADGGGIGIALPLLMAVSLLIAVLSVVVRIRSSRRS